MTTTFNISPARTKKVVNVKKVVEEIEHLTLNTFGQIPKIFFENVIVGTTIKKSIILHNPAKKCMEVGFTKLPPQERHLDLNWYHNVIPPENSVSLELSWCPVESGGWRDTLVLEDTGRIRKDIPITFKAISPKVKKIAPKFLVRKVKSPVKSRRVSPKKFLSPKKKVTTPKCNKSFAQIKNPTITITPTLPQGKRILDNIVDRSTFVINEKLNIPPISPTNVFEDSLEMPTKEFKDTDFNTILLNTPRLTKFSPLKASSVHKDMEFNETNLTYNILNESNTANISSSTYVHDCSWKTYTKETPSENLITPKLNNKKCQNQNKENRFGDTCFLFNDVPQRAFINRLENIQEVSVLSNNSPVLKENNLKRKSPLTLNLTPHKKINISANDSCVVKQINQNLKPRSSLHPIKNKTVLTALENPFINMVVTCNPAWIKEQENNFTKWLNSLLTPPLELLSDTEINVDIAKVWKECTQKVHVPEAPSKEFVSITYHTNAKYDVLKKTAMNLYHSDEVALVLTKLSNIIDHEKLTIRADQNLLLNVRLRSEIMRLFFSYNPLWLRIGLETVYGVTIPLRSNSDIYGLSNFIVLNFFKDDTTVLSKYKTIISDKYDRFIKKQMLKKFFALVFLLDKAKLKKIIPHDPCLFCKNAPFKESRDIVIQFAKETISSVGDIFKLLRTLGYNLSYKQSYIDEYSFAVSNLHTDLKNGVVLAKVMEIILLTDGITSLVRVPAISRLQKIHNVKLSFEALQKNGMAILDNIDPRDIVSGEREKTLSFLWQIIHQFQIPRWNKACGIIQTWYRSLPITIKRRILHRRIIKKEQAAIKIQNWYRRVVRRQKLVRMAILLKQYYTQKNRERAAIKIQSFYKMQLQRKNYLNQLSLIKRLQSNIRRKLVLNYINQKKRAITKIQSIIRCVIFRNKFLRLKHAALTIQNIYRSKKIMLNERNSYLTQKSSCVIIQRKFRAYQLMKLERTNFILMKSSAITIQTFYRNYKLMNDIRCHYLNLRSSTIIIQRRYRANNLMKIERNAYLQKKRAVGLIENYYQSYRLMVTKRQEFLKLKSTVLMIQRIYRTKQLRIADAEYYNKLKRMAIFVQMKFRTILTCRKERNEFLKLRKSVICIQRKYRYILQKRKIEIMKQCSAAIKIQAYYRGYITRKRLQPLIIEIKEKIRCMENFEANQLTLAERRELAVFNIIKRPVSVYKKYLIELEYITRICITSCIKLSEIFVGCLFATIFVTNKSLAEEEICLLCTDVIINVCKHSAALKISWNPEILEKIFSTMIHYSDKDTPIFSHLCTVIWLYAGVNEYKLYIRDNAHLKLMLTKMYAKCIRKKKMFLRSNAVQNSYFKDYSNEKIPNKKSDGGLKSNKPHTFNNSIFAIISLLNLLEIQF